MRITEAETPEPGNIISLKLKEIDSWLDMFRKIWETRFQQLDHLLSTIKMQEK